MSRADTAAKSGTVTTKDSAGVPAGKRAGAGGAVPAPRTRRRLVVAGLAVLVVAATVLTGLVGWRTVEERGVDQGAAAAVAAATANAPTVFSYDSATLDADLARARPLITGSFAEQFEHAATNAIIPAGRERSFAISAQVTRSALVEAASDRVVVLLLIDETIRNSAQPHAAPQPAQPPMPAQAQSPAAADPPAQPDPQPQHRALNVALTMTRTAGGPWLISDMNPL